MTYTAHGRYNIGRLVLAVILVVLLLLALALFLVPAPAAPQLGIEPTSIDLGTLPLETRTSFEFRITNTGSGVLQFNKEPYIEVVEGC